MVFEYIMGDPAVDVSLNDIDNGYENGNESKSESENESENESEEDYITEEQLTSDSVNTFIIQYKYMCNLLIKLFYKLSLNLALFFGTVMYYLKIFLNKLYESNPKVAYTMDYVTYLNKYYYGLLNDSKTEPFSNSWTSISYISNSTSIPPKYDEITYTTPKYNELIINLNNDWCNMSYVNIINDMFMIEYSKNLVQNVYKPLFISKYRSLGASRYYVSYKNPKELDFNERIPSNVRFISIVYSHPNMKDQITFEISKNWFVVQNELFTSEFVFRQLVYQYESFVFDNRYKIILLDSNVNSLELTSDKYIEILEDEYKVHTISE